MPDGPSFIDENHERIVNFANDFLDEDEREDFVDSMLERGGYERITGWSAPAEGGAGGRKPAVGRRPPAGGGKSGGRGHPGFGGRR